MTSTLPNCLIQQSACGRIAGDPICPKCGVDERVRYVSEDAGLIALKRAQEQFKAFKEEPIGNRDSALKERDSVKAGATIPTALSGGRDVRRSNGKDPSSSLQSAIGTYTPGWWTGVAKFILAIVVIVIAAAGGAWWYTNAQEKRLRDGEAVVAATAEKARVEQERNETNRQQGLAVIPEKQKAESLARKTPTQEQLPKPTVTAIDKFNEQNERELQALKACRGSELRSVSKAFGICENSADQGDYSAALIVGEAYLWGEFGVPENKRKSGKYFQIAARSGSAESIYLLGRWYEMSSSTEKLEPDVVRSWELICKAARMKHPRAMYSCSLHLEDTDPAASVAMKTEAAELGNVDAMASLGAAYQQGRKVRTDAARAIYWLTKAANAGDQQSCNNLAFAYENGDLVTKDADEAKAWRNAAKCVALKR